MELDFFNTIKPINILPHNGTVIYYGKILNEAQANQHFKTLLNNIDWRHDEAVILGKHIITKRKVAWYGLEKFSYTYSKITKSALPFTDELMALKLIAESYTNASYNSCLLNLYHDGNEGMAWHSDGEKDLLKNGSIASMSFGAERKFCFKHKSSKQKIDIILENGSLLDMKDSTQTNWMHRLPPSTKVNQPRINLTFRTILK